MCKICVEFELGKLTITEAYRNLSEVYSEDDTHNNEVWLKLLEAEIKKNKE